MNKKFLKECGYTTYFLKGESARTGGLATFTKETPKIVKRFFNKSGDALGRASVLEYGDFTLIHVSGPAGTGAKAKLAEKLSMSEKNIGNIERNSIKNDIYKITKLEFVLLKNLLYIWNNKKTFLIFTFYFSTTNFLCVLAQRVV